MVPETGIEPVRALWARGILKPSVLVREAGLEPAHLLQYRILSPGRLPIPPLPLKENRRGEI